MRIVTAFFGLVAGGMLGGLLGLLLGLGWTSLAGTSCFEGLCGYVVALWMVLGLALGALLGPWVALRLRR